MSGARSAPFCLRTGGASCRYTHIRPSPSRISCGHSRLSKSAYNCSFTSNGMSGSASARAIAPSDGGNTSVCFHGGLCASAVEHQTATTAIPASFPIMTQLTKLIGGSTPFCARALLPVPAARSPENNGHELRRRRRTITQFLTSNKALAPHLHTNRTTECLRKLALQSQQRTRGLACSGTMHEQRLAK
jgi:hypothetical protein